MIGKMRMYMRSLKIQIQVRGIIGTLDTVLSILVDLLFDKYYKSNEVSENIILFSSEPDYSDNARVLYDTMIEKGYDKKYELIWVVDDYKKYHELKSTMKCIPKYSIFPHNNLKRCRYYRYKARWIFHTHGFSTINFTRPTGQLLINLWHGGMGFKKGKGVPLENQDNYILVSGDGEITMMVGMENHQCPKEKLLPIGTPRNDLLIKYRHIPSIDAYTGAKILWMPTFRETKNKSISDNTICSETGLPIYHTFLQLEVLNKYLTTKNTHIFIKIHHLQTKTAFSTYPKYSNLHLLFDEDLERQDTQLYEILNHFSGLVSDYSSVAFDYLYLDRPMAYTLDDFENYKASRGFIMENPLEYMPGYHLYTENDFMNFISDVANNIDNYHEDRKRVKELVGLADAGGCCQRLLDFSGIY